METDDLIKWGLIGLGAYLVYENVFGTTPAATVAAPTTAPASGSTVAATPAQQTLVTLQAIGPQPVLAAAQTAKDPGLVNGAMTAWEWDWYLNQIVDINPNNATAATAPVLQGYLSSNQQVPLAAWWAAVMSWAQAEATASVQQPAAVSTGVSGGVGDIGDLGYRDASAHFAEPPAPGHARFDFEEAAW